MTMTKRLIALLLVVLPLALAGTPVVAAASEWRHHSGQRGGEEGVSLNQAVHQVQRETGGRVLSADTVSQGGRTVHRIKVLTPSGRVRVVVVDAQSGSR